MDLLFKWIFKLFETSNSVTYTFLITYSYTFKILIIIIKITNISNLFLRKFKQDLIKIRLAYKILTFCSDSLNINKVPYKKQKLNELISVTTYFKDICINI